MIVERVPVPVEATRAFSALFGMDPVAVWLDSARAEPGLARFSYLGSPGPSGEILTYAAGQGFVEVAAGGQVRREEGTILEALARRLDPPEGRADSRPDRSVDLPGAGPVHARAAQLVDGWVGYLGYELRADLGSPCRHRSPHPDAVWVRCERLLVLDHETDEAWLVAHGDDGREWVRGAQAVLAHPVDLPSPRRGGCGPGDHVVAPAPDRATTTGAAAPVGGAAPAAEPSYAELPGVLVRDTDTYACDVEACLAALRRGDSWEICLTDTVETRLEGDPFAAYLRLRALNPAPHAAYLRLPGMQVLSASPELFLHVTRDGWVETRPIKGTVGRHTDPAEDALVAAALAADPKTRAENLIIVDLLRNDLSRVCSPGTVTVPRVLAVESYATVHQLVTTVRGRLTPGRTVVDAVGACFPAGSMTGAPKLRTMEILDGLETRARGVYSGTVGFVDRSGAADLSVVIRTAVVRDGVAEVGAGGAVVLDSDPVAETEEMLLKARSVLPALRP